MNDNQFATTMMVIIGVLVALTVVILAIANVLISETTYGDDKVVQGEVKERIKPIGSLTINGVAMAANNEPSANTGSDDTSTPAVEKSAEELYTACAACHASGVLNAPKLADNAAWKPRLDKGIDTLYANAINGINGMPPKGGRADLSDDEIKKLVDYMVATVQ